MPRPRRFAAFVFNALLFIAPRDFRAEYGRSMWRDLADNLAEERLLHGWLASLVLFAGACGDVVVSGSRERFAMIARDVVFALRSLRKTPLFTAVVIVTLALAIGANAAVFSVLRAVVLAPLPYAQPQNLVSLATTSSANESSVSSLPDVLDVRARNRVFDDVAALRRSRATITGIGRPQALQGFMATWPAFAVLGTQPELGRFFAVGDERAGSGEPIVVSDRMWRQMLGANADAIGRSITLDARSYRVIGVAPPGSLFPLPDAHSLEPPDYWTILRPDPKTYARSEQRFGVIARLRQGVSLAAANADLARISGLLRAQYPATDSGFAMRATPFADIFIGPIRPILVAAFGAVGGVLIIACANVANLLLSRSAARDRELAIRFAIGATRGRIVSQILTETWLFAGISGMLGLALAWALVGSFVALDPPGVPRLTDIRVDGSVAAYTFTIVLFCTFAGGLVPALALSKPQLSDALKAAGRGGDANRGARARNAFVIAEIAISVALVVTSGLIVRSFATLADTPLGFSVDGVRVATFTGLPAARYGSDASIAEFYRASAAAVNAVPGVERAAWIAGTTALLGSEMSSSSAMQDIAQPVNQEFIIPEAAIGPQYFAVTGISLIAGRAIGAGDRLGSAPIAVVNRAFADRYYHGRPIGKWIAPSLGSREPPLHRTIVGVVANVRNSFTSDYQQMILSSAGANFAAVRDVVGPSTPDRPGRCRDRGGGRCRRSAAGGPDRPIVEIVRGCATRAHALERAAARLARDHRTLSGGCWRVRRRFFQRGAAHARVPAFVWRSDRAERQSYSTSSRARRDWRSPAFCVAWSWPGSPRDSCGVSCSASEPSIRRPMPSSWWS